MSGKASNGAQSPEVLLKKLRRLPPNMSCPNCGTSAPPGIGFGNICAKFKTFVCDLCKTSHQAISHRVKSISMSTWTLDEVNELTEERGGGNLVAAHVWLHNAPPFGSRYPGGVRPKQGDRIEIFKQFISDCYESGKFKATVPYVSANPSPPPVAPVSNSYPTPVSQPIQSVIKQSEPIKNIPTPKKTVEVDLLDMMSSSTNDFNSFPTDPIRSSASATNTPANDLFFQPQNTQQDSFSRNSSSGSFTDPFFQPLPQSQHSSTSGSFSDSFFQPKGQIDFSSRNSSSGSLASNNGNQQQEDIPSSGFSFISSAAPNGQPKAADPFTQSSTIDLLGANLSFAISAPSPQPPIPPAYQGQGQAHVLSLSMPYSHSQSLPLVPSPSPTSHTPSPPPPYSPSTGLYPLQYQGQSQQGQSPKISTPSVRSMPMTMPMGMSNFNASMAISGMSTHVLNSNTNSNSNSYMPNYLPAPSNFPNRNLGGMNNNNNNSSSSQNNSLNAFDFVNSEIRSQLPSGPNGNGTPNGNSNAYRMSGGPQDVRLANTLGSSTNQYNRY